MTDSIQSHGQEKIQKYLNKVREKLDYPSDLYVDLAELILFQTQLRFTTGVGVDGRAWQKSWRARVQSGQTLRDTGRLLNSLKPQTNRNQISVKTNVKYAPLMQFGGIIRAKNGKYLTFKTPTSGWVKVKSVYIPPRPFFGINPDDSQEILFEIEEYLERILNDGT